MQIRAFYGHDDALRMPQPQRLRNAALQLLVGGCGHGAQHRAAGERRHKLPNLLIRRAERVAPLHHAVRFVHDDHRGRTLLAERVNLRVIQPLRRKKSNLCLTARELIQRVGAFGEGHQAVEMDAGDTLLPQVANLVVHEDNQRRNDDGQLIHH